MLCAVVLAYVVLSACSAASCILCNSSHAAARARRLGTLSHFYNTVPPTEGNHNPSFLKGPDITVFEDDDPYSLGRQWAKALEDGNGNNHQLLHFELANDNNDLFTVQPHINVCHGGCQCRCPNIANCGQAPTCGCGTGCGAAACGGGPGCPLSQTGTLMFTVNKNRFGTATVEVVLIDNGFPDPICSGAVSPNCVIVPCDREPCTHSSVMEFKITVIPVNDMPDFKHRGNIESPEDSEWCSTRWAYDVTAGGWEEEYGQRNGQLLSWRVTHNNSNLFQTPPYIRYVQGDQWADLCYTPAKDMTGTARVEIYLSDNGGDANGGISTRRPSPEVIYITIYEVNDPPFFTPGPSRIEVEEDGPRYNMPWASGMKPGPNSEVAMNQQLDRFEVKVLDDSNLVMFTELPNIDPETGFLRFTTAPDANTFHDAIECSVVLWDIPLASRCPLCPALPSKEPHPTFTIAIAPVNDPPSFRPPSPSNVTLTEDQINIPPLQWALDICVGKQYPNCIESEGDPSREAQEVKFDLTWAPQAIISTAAMDAKGLLSIELLPDAFGEVVLTVKQRDTGPPPNENPNATSFTLTVLPVNDMPFFNRTDLPDIVKIAEDAGAVRLETMLRDLRAGPDNEENQLLNFTLRVDRPELFAEPPTFQPVWHLNGRLHADLLFTPAPDRFGDADVTFTMSDNGGTDRGGVDTTKEVEFVIRIEPVNDPPSFAIPSKIVEWEDAGNEGPDRHHVIGFARNVTPGAHEGDSQRVSFMVSSLPGPFVTPPTINSQGSLKFHLQPDWFGEVKVTVVARDVDKTTGGELPDSLQSPPQTFLLSVLPVNDPPTFEVNTTLHLPPCMSNTSCVHRLSNWIRNLSPGPSELSQTVVELTARVVYAERTGSLDGVVVLHMKDLEVAVAAGAGAVPELHVVTLVARDDGGRAEGGMDTTQVNFTITVTPDAATPPPRERRVLYLNVTQQPRQVSSTLILAPIFSYVGEGDQLVEMGGTNITLTLVTVEGAGELVGYTPHSEAPRSNFTWHGLRITAPGTYLLRGRATFPDGATLENTTQPFVMVPDAVPILESFQREGNSSRLVSEHDVRSGGTLLLRLDQRTSSRVGWSPDGGVYCTAAVYAKGDLTPSPLPVLRGVVDDLDPTLLHVVLQPVPTFDTDGDGVLEINLTSTSFRGVQRVHPLQLVTQRLLYPLLGAPKAVLAFAGGGAVIDAAEVRNAGVELLLSLGGPATCCDTCTVEKECCAGCFAPREVDGYLPQALAALGSSHGVFSREKASLITAATLRRPNLVAITLGPYPAYTPAPSEVIFIESPWALHSARGVAPESTDRGVRLVEHAEAVRISPMVDPADYEHGATALAAAVLAASVVTQPFQSALAVGEVGLVASLARNPCQPPLAGMGRHLEWVVMPFRDTHGENAAVVIVVLLVIATLHSMLVPAFARGTPHRAVAGRLLFPNLVIFVSYALLPTAVWGTGGAWFHSGDSPGWMRVLLTLGLLPVVLLLGAMSIAAWREWRTTAELVWAPTRGGMYPTGKHLPATASFLQRYKPVVVPFLPTRLWWGGVEVLRLVLLPLITVHPNTSVSSCRGQMWVASLALAGYVVAVAVVRPFSALPITVLRLAVGVLQLAAFLALAIPLSSFSPDGGMALAARSGWEASLATPPLLVTSLALHLVLVLYTAWSWWWAQRPSAGEERATPEGLQRTRLPYQWAADRELLPEVLKPTPSNPLDDLSPPPVVTSRVCTACLAHLPSEGRYCPGCGVDLTPSPRPGLDSRGVPP